MLRRCFEPQKRLGLGLLENAGTVEMVGEGIIALLVVCDMAVIYSWNYEPAVVFI